VGCGHEIQPNEERVCIGRLDDELRPSLDDDVLRLELNAVGPGWDGTNLFYKTIDLGGACADASTDMWDETHAIGSVRRCDVLPSQIELHLDRLIGCGWTWGKKERGPEKSQGPPKKHRQTNRSHFHTGFEVFPS